MIIYKNVDYGIYAYQIGFFKVKRIGEIVWSDQQNLNENYPYMIVYPKTFGEKILKDNETLYRIYEHLGFYFTEEMVDRTKADNEMRYDFIVKKKRRKFLYRTNFFSYL